MIEFKIDSLGRHEIPELILCNPDRTELGVINHHKALNYIPKVHGLSEISFNIHSHYKRDGELIKNPLYDYIVKNRLISMCADYEDENSPKEWFIIFTADINYLGEKISTKTVKCYSYERSLGKRNVDFLDGTYKLYDYTSPTDSVLGKALTATPQWSIGTVEASLLNQWRTFEEIEDTLYDFLVGECEEAYGCIFVFDNDNLTINAYDRSSFVTSTNIIMSHSNLIKDLKVGDSLDEVVTALSVVGGGDVDIRSVNPIGENYIYDYSHYMTTAWMSQALIDAIKKWQTKVDGYRSIFSNYLTNLKTYKTQLLTLNTQLTDLKSELNALDQVRSSQMTTSTGVLAVTTKSYNAKATEIKNKEAEITQKNNQITTVNTSLNNIVSACKKSANFTSLQLQELDRFTFQGEYQNTNYITTDSMTEAEKQGVYEDLYQRGLKELPNFSSPQYTFSLESMNFLFMEKFKQFTREIKLGCMVNVEMQNDLWSYPILLEMKINYDNPTDFSMTFGTKLNMKSTLKDLNEALKDAVNTNTKVAGNAATWDIPVKSGILDEVSSYMNNTLDLAHQQIVNAKSQTIEIADWGLQIRKLLSNGSYDQRQFRLTNGVLAMTDDNWNSSKLAIGIVNGVSAVNAEVIAGVLLAGNLLKITNEQGSFIVDGDKVTTTNMVMTLTKGLNKITLNPSTGLRLIKNDTTMVDFNITTGDAKFNGSGTFSGTIIATAGSIGGWTINSSGIYNTATGDKIMSNGTGKLSLFTWGTDWAKFAGELSVTKGTIAGFVIDGTQIRSSNNAIQLNTDGSGQLSKYITWTKDGDVSINGKIITTEGTIGGFIIGSNSLKSSNDKIQLNNSGSGQLSSNFTWDTSGNVTLNGKIIAKSGTIGEFIIGTNSLKSSNNMIQLNNSGSGQLSSNFKWDTSGNVTLNGNITTVGGTIGGFKISSAGIYSTNSDSLGSLINLRSDGTGRIGLMSFGKDWAIFDGRIYASNLGDQITAGNMAEQSVPTYAYQTNSIPTGAYGGNSIPYAAYGTGSIGASKFLNSGGDSVAEYVRSLMTDYLTVAQYANIQDMDVRALSVLDTLGYKGKGFEAREITVRNSAGTGTVTFKYWGW